MRLCRPIASAADAVSYSGIDPDLRELLARCLAVEKGVRTDFENVLHIVEKAVTERDEHYYSTSTVAANETDHAIRTLVQQLVLDPDRAVTTLVEDKQVESRPATGTTTVALWSWRRFSTW